MAVQAQVLVFRLRVIARRGGTPGLASCRRPSAHAPAPWPFPPRQLSSCCEAVVADVLRVPRTFPRHDGAEADAEAPIALLALPEGAAVVRAVLQELTQGVATLSEGHCIPGSSALGTKAAQYCSNAPVSSPPLDVSVCHEDTNIHTESLPCLELKPVEPSLNLSHVAKQKDQDGAPTSPSC